MGSSNSTYIKTRQEVNQNLFKLTIKQASKLDCYTIPKVEDLLAILAGEQKFTKLDLSQGYQQVRLAEQAK